MANAAQLGRWEERVYLDERSPIPFAFVFEQANEIAESGIRNDPSQAAILEHVLGAERLHNNHLVLVNESSAPLLKKVCSDIRYPLMNLGDSQASLLSVLRALGTTAEMFLCGVVIVRTTADEAEPPATTSGH